MAEPGDDFLPLQPDPNPVPTLPETGDRGAGAPGGYAGGGTGGQDAYITGDVTVTFRYQLHNNRTYPRATADATGIPRFLSFRTWRQTNYVQFRIRGERPMTLVILMNDNMVYQDVISTEQSCMKIRYRRRDLPFRLIVQLWNNLGSADTPEYIIR